MRLGDREDRFSEVCHARLFGRSIEWHDLLESTQDRGGDLAAQGAPEGQLVVALEQRRGRGRSGSVWISPAGGLWVSLLLRPAGPADTVVRLTRVMADVVRDCLEFDLGVVSTVKEPNDVLVGGRKIAGILAEASSRAGDPGVEWMVLGLGLDVRNRPPSELAHVATRLADHLPSPPELEEILARIVERFEKAYEPWIAR